MRMDVQDTIRDCRKCERIKGVTLKKPEVFCIGEKPRVMILVHSPTVRSKEQAEFVLKMDMQNRALYKYIVNDILNNLSINVNEVYCTNLIKCYTEKLPEDVDVEIKNYIKGISGNCLELFEKELKSIHPQLIISLSGRVFEIMSERYMNKKMKIQNAFGQLYDITIDGMTYKYIPVIHLPKWKKVKERYMPEQTNRLQSIRGVL